MCVSPLGSIALDSSRRVSHRLSRGVGMHAIQRKLAWGHRYLGRKDWLAKGIARFKRANGAQSFPYLPATYLLPDDRLKLIGISHALPAACLGITRFRSVVHWLAEVASAQQLLSLV